MPTFNRSLPPRPAIKSASMSCFLAAETYFGFHLCESLASDQFTCCTSFTVAPYNRLIGSLGFLSISGFIGAAIVIFFGGKIIDIIANRMTHRNHGRREPEYRLPGKRQLPIPNSEL